LPGTAKRVRVLGVPLDLGASKQGASGGPAAIRLAGLASALENLNYTVQDHGDVDVPPAPAKSPKNLRNASAILKVCKELERGAYDAARSGAFPLTIGGDHSLAMGSVSGVARAWREKEQPIGLIWVDAHADINTPQTSPSGNLHGMPLAHILGLGHKDFAKLGGFSPKVRPENTCLIGVRDVDKEEAVILRKSGIRVFSMTEVDTYGMAAVAQQAIAAASEGTAGFHLSFDVDVVDPAMAPGTGTLKRGGLTYREAQLLMELTAASKKLIGLDLVEVNPLEDVQNWTAVLGVELIASALGKRIY